MTHVLRIAHLRIALHVANPEVGKREGILGSGLMSFHDDRQCTILSKHTSIIHTQSCILVLGLGLGHVHDD